MIWSIDPGTIESAMVRLIDDGCLNPQDGDFVKDSNEAILATIRKEACGDDEIVIEMVASYGMSVGAEVFETVVWIGRFMEAALLKGATVTRMPRMAVKMHLCHAANAKDSNIRQALVDRFGDKGTKAKPGWFYGFKADIWAAYALALTYAETREAGRTAKEA